MSDEIGIVAAPAEKQRASQSNEEKRRRARNRAARKRNRTKKRLAAEERRAAKKILAANESREAEKATSTHMNNLTPTAEVNTSHAGLEPATPTIAASDGGAIANEKKISFPAALKKIEITDHGILLTTDSFPGDLEALTKFLEQDAVMTLELPAVETR